MFKLSQETIAIITVGLTLAGLITTTHLSLRAEMRAEREAIRAEAQAARAEAQAVRAEAQAAREAHRAEAQAAREAHRAEAQAAREVIRAEGRADREAFGKQILRLSQEQSRLTGIVDQIRTAER